MEEETKERMLAGEYNLNLLQTESDLKQRYVTLTCGFIKQN